MPGQPGQPGQSPFPGRPTSPRPGFPGDSNLPGQSGQPGQSPFPRGPTSPRPGFPGDSNLPGEPGRPGQAGRPQYPGGPTSSRPSSVDGTSQFTRPSVSQFPSGSSPVLPGFSGSPDSFRPSQSSRPDLSSNFTPGQPGSSTTNKFDLLGGGKQPSGTSVITPTQPTNMFCNCSPFDIICVNKCSEVIKCEDSASGCDVSSIDGKDKPNFPTYPTPSCGGVGEKDCPYPPAGLKPSPEFTYPPSYFNTTQKNEFSSGKFPSSQFPTLQTSSLGNRPSDNSLQTSKIPNCGFPLASFCGPDGLPPIYVVPYPVPIVPAPGNCPCYLVSPTSNETSESATPPPFTTQSPSSHSQGFVPQGVIGYIPVVFFPFCPENHTNPDMIQPYFPQAFPVPYPCQQCQNPNVLPGQRKSSFSKRNQLSDINKFTDPNFYPSLAFSNFLEESNKNVSRDPRKKRIKIRRRISRRQPNVEPSSSFEQIMKQGNIQYSQIVKSPHRSSRIYGQKIHPVT